MFCSPTQCCIPFSPQIKRPAQRGTSGRSLVTERYSLVLGLAGGFGDLADVFQTLGNPVGTKIEAWPSLSGKSWVPRVALGRKQCGYGSK